MGPIVPATLDVEAVGAHIKCAVGAVETLTIGLDRKPEVAGRLAMICGRIGPHPRANLALSTSWLFETAESAADCAARSEEHTSELQSLMRISYAVFCFKK